MKTAKSKAQDALIVAKYLTERYNILSSVKLQKLMYFVYIEYLKKTGKKLFEGNFQAWIYGPVIPKLFSHVKRYGLNFEKFSDSQLNLSTTDKKIIESAVLFYNKYQSEELVWISHQTSPWLKARKDLKDSEISKQKILIRDLKEYARNYSRNKTAGSLRWQ